MAASTQPQKVTRPLPVYRYVMAGAISMKLMLLVLLYPLLHGTARLVLVGLVGTAIALQLGILISNIRRDFRRQRGL